MRAKQCPTAYHMYVHCLCVCWVVWFSGGESMNAVECMPANKSSISIWVYGSGSVLFEVGPLKACSFVGVAAPPGGSPLFGLLHREFYVINMTEG